MSEATQAAPAATPQGVTTTNDTSASAPQSEQAGQNGASASPAQDDPEIELVGGQKVKRSVLSERFSKHEEYEKRLKEKERGLDAKFRENAKQIKQARDLMEAFHKNPRAVLRQVGHDEIQFAEQVLTEHLQRAQMTPEQREAAEVRAERDRLAEEKKAKEESDQQQAEAAEVQRYEQAFENAFVQAMGTARLPKNHKTVARMAEKVQLYLERGQPPPFDAIAREVRQDIIDEKRQVLAELQSDEELAEFLGADVLERTRKYHLAKVAPPQATQSPQTRAAQTARRAPQKALTPGEFRARIEQR